MVSGDSPTATTLAIREPDPNRWLIQHCSTPGCDVAIRVLAVNHLTNPICKWCDQGISRAKNPKGWPDGMPDPELPWPWMTESDREQKLRVPFWKERLRSHGDLYQAWLRT